MATHQLPFLQLNSETATNGPVDTDIVGVVPKWLEGSLYRNGPGIYKVGDTTMKHLFDGFAIIHRFQIHGGKVSYTSRVLDSNSWQESVKLNRLAVTQFGTYSVPDPCKSIFSRMMTFFKGGRQSVTDNTSVNIVEHGDRLYALTETPWLLRVDPEKLTQMGREDLKETVAVHYSTAHPHFDRHGNMYNLATAFNPPNNYNIVRLPPPKDGESEVSPKAELVASLRSRWHFNIGYNHSFGMSRDYFVILEQPIAMHSMKFLAMSRNLRQSSIHDNFTKYPREQLVFRVVGREDGKEVDIRYRTDPTFTFHFVNCYQDEGHLVVDFCGYSDLSVLEKLYLDTVDSGTVTSSATFRRYVLPLCVDKAKIGDNLVTLPYTTASARLVSNNTVHLEPDYITDKRGVMMELPRINYAMANGTKYRYAYGTTFLARKSKLLKLDLEKREVCSWHEAGYLVGEPVFVASPGATDEDDGVILSPVLGMVKGLGCFLLILDAKSFTELARAKAPPGVDMAASFHGTYVASGL